MNRRQREDGKGESRYYVCPLPRQGIASISMIVCSLSKRLNPSRRALGTGKRLFPEQEAVLRRFCIRQHMLNMEEKLTERERET